MGCNSSQNCPSPESHIFGPSIIGKSANKIIQSLYLDQSESPSPILHVIGTEYIENYSEGGQKLLCYYASPSPILTSALSSTNIKGSPLLLVGCADKTILVLNSASLVLIGQITISLKLEHLALPDYDIRCSEKNYFQLFAIDNIVTFKDSLLVGLSNGIVKSHSLDSFQLGPILNPIPLEYPLQKDERKSITIENAHISGIESIVCSQNQDFILVNHKSAFTNCLNETYNLVDTPICIYRRNGEPVKRMKVQGEIKQGKVLENRNFYLCLTSVDSHLYIFNLEKFTVIKMSLDFVGDPDKPLRFTGLAVHEFEVNQRFLKTDKVFHRENHKGKGSKGVLDGDIIFGIEDTGAILVSKLTYEGKDKKMHWEPVKYINSKNKIKRPRKSVQLYITKHAGSMMYAKDNDKLYLSDHNDQVVILSDVLRKCL